MQHRGTSYPRPCPVGAVISEALGDSWKLWCYSEHSMNREMQTTQGVLLLLATAILWLSLGIVLWESRKSLPSICSSSTNRPPSMDQWLARVAQSKVFHLRTFHWRYWE